ncbi:hypothetical protein [Salinisphaera sp.]|uniref:DUF1641 domain-containing protein n=1 Tax=Salinisphaera sp. TaxID=1914330 RepID=UPI002D77234F|nr:hypothetical protein [Salinisphaera sp.]HET7313642.1 hypothetical protein [Salinisphaera sp.]
MARRLDYNVPKLGPEEKIRRDAYYDLDQLVISLHRHGVLRLLRDLSGSLSEVALLPVREMDNEQGYDALANLYVLAGLLGRVPSGDFKRTAEAMNDGFAAMGRTPSGDQPYPPGLTGAYELLKDEELWRALGPVLEGIKAFTRELRKEEESGQSSSSESQA